MTQEEISMFYRPINQNDINIIEKIVYPIFSKKSIEDKHYWMEIRSLFKSAMKNVKLNFFKRNIFWLYVNRIITKGLKKEKPLIEIENTLRNFIRKHANNDKDKYPISLQRAKTNFENIKNYIIGEKILDLGAGDGLLAQEIKDQLGKEVILVDIIDYNYTNLPLILYDSEKSIPLADDEVDTTILYTVLHHSSDPKHLLKEATRITKQRLIIKEAYIDNDDIRITNSFFDWFYNRVIGDEDINVPLNYLKIEKWKILLKSYGFDTIETRYVGIDEPIIPEYQVLIIANNIN